MISQPDAEEVRDSLQFELNELMTSIDQLLAWSKVKDNEAEAARELAAAKLQRALYIRNQLKVRQ